MAGHTKRRRLPKAAGNDTSLEEDLFTALGGHTIRRYEETDDRWWDVCVFCTVYRYKGRTERDNSGTALGQNETTFEGACTRKFALEEDEDELEEEDRFEGWLLRERRKVRGK